MHEMLKAWRARAEGGIAFQQRRWTKAGWLWLVLRGWKAVARQKEEREQARANGEEEGDSCMQGGHAEHKTKGTTAGAGKKRKTGTGQGTGRVRKDRTAAIYHNCKAIARWMKLRTRAPEVEAPAAAQQRAAAVSTIAWAWREQVRRRSAPGVGKRRTAGRVVRVAPEAQQRVKRFSQKVRNARKLFLGINVRVALERPRPMGSSWRSEWDFG